MCKRDTYPHSVSFSHFPQFCFIFFPHFSPCLPRKNLATPLTGNEPCSRLKEYSVILTTPFYDIYEKILILFPKFQLILILHLQVMHDHVHWHCSIDLTAHMKLHETFLLKKWLHFHKEMVSAK